jgi:hypothetical protein
MNITNNIFGKCKLTCKYSYNYSLMDFNGENKGLYLLFKPIDTEQRYDQAIYNNKKYQVKEMRIYRNSIHNYGGKKVEAELIIVHESNMGALLNVCIPIKAKSVPRRKMTFAEMVALFNAELPTLVTHMAKFAPSQGGSAGKVGLDTFTLNDLIPKEKYLVHSRPVNGSSVIFPLKGEYIVFKEDSAILISDWLYKVMKKIIQENDFNKIEKLQPRRQAFLEGFTLFGGFKEGNTTITNDNNRVVSISEDKATLINEDKDKGVDDSYECYTVDEENKESEYVLQSQPLSNSTSLTDNINSGKFMEDFQYIATMIVVLMIICGVIKVFFMFVAKIGGAPIRPHEARLRDLPQPAE